MDSLVKFSDERGENAGRCGYEKAIKVYTLKLEKQKYLMLIMLLYVLTVSLKNSKLD